MLSENAKDEFLKVIRAFRLSCYEGDFSVCFTPLLYWGNPVPRQKAIEILNIISPEWEIAQLFDGSEKDNDLSIELLIEMKDFVEETFESKMFFEKYKKEITAIIEGLKMKYSLEWNNKK